MFLNKIKMAIYAMFLTNLYGFKLKNIVLHSKRKKLRLQYAEQLLSKLNIQVKIKNIDKLPIDGQFLLISNHRSIIDPLVAEIALKNRLPILPIHIRTNTDEALQRKKHVF